MITQQFKEQLVAAINALPTTWEPSISDTANRSASLEVTVANALQRIGQLEIENQQMLDELESLARHGND